MGNEIFLKSLLCPKFKERLVYIFVVVCVKVDTLFDHKLSFTRGVNNPKNELLFHIIFVEMGCNLT